jgi:hypothetical protein
VMFQSRAVQFEQAFVLFLDERQGHMDLLGKYVRSLLYSIYRTVIRSIGKILNSPLISDLF